MFCNGEESCDEAQDQCATTGDPCPDDELFCTGKESCDEAQDQCATSGDPCPDDSLFCNGIESCDEAQDQCATTGDPCPDDELFCNGKESCDEAQDQCATTGDPCPDDSLFCNGIESCDEAQDQCATTGDPCPDDSLFCTGEESCDEAQDQCATTGDPCPDDELFCNGEESCDEAQDQCATTGDPCPDDELFCNGEESCDEVQDQCLTTGDPCPDDSLFCNGVESCDEAQDQCATTGDPCPDDELFCNGIESCDEAQDHCEATGDPCIDEYDCTIDICYEDSDSCENQPEDIDGDGFGDKDCPGGTDCDDSNPEINPDAIELCNDYIDNDCDDQTDLFEPDYDYDCVLSVDCEGTRTIQDCIDDLSGGGLCLVEQCEEPYFENILLEDKEDDKKITLRSDANGDGNPFDYDIAPFNTVIDGQNSGSVVIFAYSNDSALIGFTIQNGNKFRGGGIDIGESNPEIKHCIIKDNIADIGGGIYVQQGDPIITNTMIVKNQANFNGGGIYSTLYSNPQIIHSTIADNLALGDGYGIFVDSPDAKPVIKNSILWNLKDEFGGAHEIEMNAECILPACGVEITYSDIQGGADPSWGVENINADPLFVDTDIYDYHIKEGSPCIDTGEFYDDTDDIDGDVRSSEIPVDMGADEYNCRDEDGDGYGDESCGGIDCDDTNPEINPGAEEICDGIDNNCILGIDEEPEASSNCNNEIFCDGVEFCSAGICRAGIEVECDDGLFCNGFEICDWGLDQCLSIGEPCPDNGVFCDGEEICDEEIDLCTITEEPCPDDGQFCTGIETCDWETDQCLTTAVPCIDNGVFCDGAEVCDEVSDVCTTEGEPCPDDGQFCTGIEICDWELDQCTATPVPCLDNGVFCDGVEVCDEVSDVCTTAGEPCPDDGQFCTGIETCDWETDQCTVIGVPCLDDGLFCTGEESCDEASDQCLSSGDPCTDESACTFDLCNEEEDSCLFSCLASSPLDACCSDDACVDLSQCLCWDNDADGYNDIACGGNDCNDSDPEINPGAIEFCLGIVDKDCDDLVGWGDPDCQEPWDADADGYYSDECGGDDCDDLNDQVNPGQIEICGNEIDDDCDGDIDSGDFDCIFTVNGQGCESISSNFDSIQGCIDNIYDDSAIKQGSVCYIASNCTYVENIDFRGLNIILRSYVYEEGKDIRESAISAEDTIIDGNLSGSVVKFQSYESEKAILDGFKITNGNGTYSDLSEFGEDPASYDYRGGGVFIYGSSPTIKNCIITNNDAVKAGGGMYIRNNSSPFIDNCKIENNTSNFGAGILVNLNSNLIIEDSSISSNSAQYFGGGIHSNSSTVNISNSIIQNNDACRSFSLLEGCGGGGVSFVDTSTFKISNSKITGNNSRDWYGGGIYSRDSSDSLLLNTIIVENSAKSGGGINYRSVGTSLQIYNSTIANNIASYRGGGIYRSLGSLGIKNSILWGNQSGSSYPQMYGSATVAYSDIQMASSEYDWDGIKNINMDPLFVDAENGDYHIMPTSPCIDHGRIITIDGEDLNFDFDGDLRPLGMAYDIGADEVDCKDEDRDFHPEASCGGNDCDDLDPEIHSDIYEGISSYKCFDGIDNDCDEAIDSADYECPGGGYVEGCCYSELAGVLTCDTTDNSFEQCIDHSCEGFEEAYFTMVTGFCDCDYLEVLTGYEVCSGCSCAEGSETDNCSCTFERGEPSESITVSISYDRYDSSWVIVYEDQGTGDTRLWNPEGYWIVTE